MQQIIYKEQSLGINGQISKAESQNLATIQGVLMQDTQIGAPVAFGTNENELVTTGITVDNFVGFVVRDGFVNSEMPTEIYKAGRTVTVITKGNLFITAPADAKQGQYAYFGDNGVLSFSDDIGPTFCGWRVSTGGNYGEVIEITTQLKG